MSDNGKPKVSDFTPQRRNANKHNQRGMGLLQKSIEGDGFIGAMTSAADGEIIAGSARLEKSAEVFGVDAEPIVIDADGTRPIIVRRTDIKTADDPRAKRLAIADNRIQQVDLEWDTEVLQGLAEFDGIDLGDWWNEKELKDIGIETEKPEDAGPQIDRAEELREKWGVESGQLWRLGDHRLICGDCTDKAVVERVMDGERASMCFTSPPYNAGKTPTEGKSGKESKYNADTDNRSNDDYFALLTNFTEFALECSEFVFVNIQILANNKNSFIDYVIENRKKLCDIAIWDKKTAQPAMAKRVMDSRFEFVLIFGGNGSRAVGTREFRGMVHNVYDGHPQRENDNADLHAATMPIDVPEYFISNFTNKGETIYEPFDGTGTTLIACERLGRKCRAVEISPAYVAVAIQRWVDMTNGTPELCNS